MGCLAALGFGTMHRSQRAKSVTYQVTFCLKK